MLLELKPILTIFYQTVKFSVMASLFSPVVLSLLLFCDCEHLKGAWQSPGIASTLSCLATTKGKRHSEPQLVRAKNLGDSSVADFALSEDDVLRSE